jgi:hypothetical protein
MIVLRMGSPYTATLGGAIAWAALQETKKLQSQGQVWSQVTEEFKECVYNYRSGSLYASWGAYISFFRDICGWRDPTLEKFKIDEELIRSCGWVWWHENVLAISDRPRIIKHDEEGRLHCEDGPAMLYPDGWALWRQRGEEWDENSLAVQAIKACMLKEGVNVL